MISHREKLSLDAIYTELDINSTKQIFEFLGQTFSPHITKNKTIIQQLFMQQEGISSSGIGHGVALPHLQIDGVKKPVCNVLKLKHPVSFDSIDDIPVDVVCALISPAEDGPHHLRRLSRLSRLLRDEDFCAQIRETDDHHMIRSMFTNIQTQMLQAA